MNVGTSLICVALIGVAIVGSVTGDPQVKPEVVRAILAAAEQVDPERIKLHDLTDEKRDELVRGVLEHLASSEAEKLRTENMKPISRNSEDYKTFREALKELSGSTLRYVPMHAGFSPHQLMALASVGREHCNKKELEKRHEVCAKLSDKPKYQTFCRVAHELCVEWCERPVSIESPFAELLESISPKAEFSTNFARARLNELTHGINYASIPYHKMLDWQKRTNFDVTLEILRKVKNKEELFRGRSSAKDLLALVSIDKSQCTGSELVKRRDHCRTISDMNMSAYCEEAYERSAFWCRKSGFTDIPASNQPSSEASTSSSSGSSSTGTKKSRDKINRCFGWKC